MKTTGKQLSTAILTVIFLIALNINVNGSTDKLVTSENNKTMLQMENWMTNETIWNPNTTDTTEFVPKEKFSLELEDWLANYASTSSKVSRIQPSGSSNLSSTKSRRKILSSSRRGMPVN